LGEQRAVLEQECLRRLKESCKRVLFRRALDCARRGVAIKENVKSDFVQQVCHARLLLLELGRRWLSADAARIVTTSFPEI
jgi:hypothetical protein